MRKSRRIELHHVGSGNNSELCCELCVPCHISVSNRQLAWDSRWTHSDNHDMVKASFLVDGVRELLLQKHFLTGIRDYQIMADALPSLIRYYREGC